LNSVSDKLIRRHPHIYGDVEVADAEEVKRNWEQIKLAEGKKSVLEGVPKSLPAMVKANRIQEKARGVGFDWENQDQVWGKVKEELAELRVEVEAGAPKAKIEDEFGDVLFSLINYSRFIDINPEDALERTNKKFIQRFQYLEEQANAQGKKLADMTLEEMESIWQAAKTASMPD
jgi:XTP/dITP diphosphohydrolase